MIEFRNPGNAFAPEILAAERVAIVHPKPIVVIGCGTIVRDAHLPAYRKAGFPVAALVDSQVSKASALAEQYGVPAAVAGLEQVPTATAGDCIFDLAVPARLILDVLPSLPDGAAVLIQKPMGETLQEARRIVELCQHKRLTAAVNFQLRWAPVMVAARRMAEAGKIGELHDLEVEVTVHTPWSMWTFLNTAPRLEILYHSIHYIDLVRSWLGNPASVYARTVRNPRSPNLAATKSAIILDYGDWKRVRISTNHHFDFSAESQQSYVQWEGTNGVMRALMGVNLDYPRGLPDSLTYLGSEGDWSTVKTEGNWFPEAFIGSMASLQAYVTGAATELPTRIEDALDTMRVVEAAYLSSERGGTPLP